ncbi:LLM class flavin-dependent oxidoreductase [Nocardia sp. KC 131]|uniref:LLM class flavin-dependent oxidoreductase n=1 Tax=Nocardia arseniciresistens TaxID=3392119 RepID=UPI00398E518B
MTHYSILMPFGTPRGEQILPFAALTQWSKAFRLWQGQSVAGDPYQVFAHAAASGFRVPIGLGVTLMPFRHPYEAALQAQSAAATMGHPLIAGFGPGAIPLQKSLLAKPYASQLGAVREYLTIVRALLNGEEVRTSGEYFTCFNTLPSFPGPPVEVGAGVLRPAMAQLVGEVADVAITWLTPASYIRDVIVPELRTGARVAGRPAPKVVAVVPLGLAGPDRDGVDLALTSNSGHLRLKHYTDMLAGAGIAIDMADERASGRAIIDGGAYLFGTVQEIAVRLAEYAAAGVDEIVLNVTGVAFTYGTQAALQEIETVLSEMAR